MRVEFKGNLGILSIRSTATETLNSMLMNLMSMNLMLTSLVPKVLVRVLKVVVNSRKLLDFTFLMFPIFDVSQRIVQWRHGAEV